MPNTNTLFYGDNLQVLRDLLTAPRQIRWSSGIR